MFTFPKPENRRLEILMAALHFNEDDLAANYNGQLTDHQRERLESERWFWQFIRSVVLGAGLCVLMAVVLNIKPHEPIPREGYLVLIAALFTAYCHRTVQRIQKDIDNGHVEMTEGRVFTPNRAAIRLSGQKFSVPRFILVKFNHGEYYRLFYTPLTRYIVAAIWLDKPKNKQKQDSEIMEQV